MTIITDANVISHHVENKPPIFSNDKEKILEKILTRLNISLAVKQDPVKSIEPIIKYIEESPEVKDDITVLFETAICVTTLGTSFKFMTQEQYIKDKPEVSKILAQNFDSLDKIVEVSQSQNLYLSSLFTVFL